MASDFGDLGFVIPINHNDASSGLQCRVGATVISVEHTTSTSPSHEHALPHLLGFSVLYILVTVGPVGILALSFCGHESISQKREAQRYIVALIRSAKAYQTRGGGLSGATNAHQVLSKLKTVADASSFLKVKVDPNSSSTGLFLKGKQSEQRLDLPIRGLVWRSSLTLMR